MSFFDLNGDIPTKSYFELAFLLPQMELGGNFNLDWEAV